MKSGILVGILALVLSISVLAFAQGPGMMGGGYGGGPGYGGGYGMGPGMMGPGYGGGYGGGQGYGGGYGMGPGMMGPGYGGGYGGGARQGYGLSEECQKYFDESAGKRKELHVKQFDYSEALRNPKTKPEHVTKLEKEIWDLQKEIYTNTPRNCR